MLVKPDFLGWRALLKKQEVRADVGVRFEDAVRQADDGVEVALFHQVFLEPRLHSFAEERPIGQHHGSAAFGFQDANYKGQEEVGSLASLEVFGEVTFDAVFLTPTERRIRKNDVHAIRLRVADVRPRKCVVVVDESGILNAVQEHIGDAEHVRELFLLDCSQPLLHVLLILYFFHVPVAHVTNSASEESARTARRIQKDFAGPGSIRSTMKAVTARGV